MSRGVGATRRKQRSARGGPSLEPVYAPIDRRTFLSALLIAGAVFIVYIPVYDAGFIWDDDDHILLNTLLTDAGGLAEIWDPRSELNPQYYPMVFTTFFIERRLYGLSPLGYHVVNVVLHALNAGLLLFVLRRVRVRGAWVVAGLFALHPVCVESVAWVTERKNVLSGCFYFLSILAYLRYDASNRFRWYGLSLGGFALALLSKTVTASLPITLGLLLWYRRRPLSASRVATLGLMVLIGLAMGTLTKWHEADHMMTEGTTLAGLTFVDRLLAAGRAFWFYPSTIAWPVNLAFMRTRWDISAGDVGPWLFAVAALGAVVVPLVLCWRGRMGRSAPAATLFYAATIFPALGFVDVAFMRFSPVADHFQYLACIGTLLLVVGAGWRLIAPGGETRAGRSRSAVGSVVAVALMALLGWCAARQAGIYHDPGTLWADTARKSPGNYMAQNNYGAWLKSQGDSSGAATCFERAISVSRPESEGAVLGHNNLASVRLGQGRFADALASAECALALKPDFAFALSNKGRALWRLGRLAEAEATMRSFLERQLDPGAGRAAWDIRRRLEDADELRVLAEIQGDRGDFDTARGTFARAIRSQPTLAKIHVRRMAALTRWHRYPDAIAAAREATRCLEDDVPFRLQLAWLLAVAPFESDRNGDEALALATDLVSQLGKANPLALSVLAAAQAELGRFDAAEATARSALDMGERTGADDLLGRLRTQVAYYTKGKAVREPR